MQKPDTITVRFASEADVEAGSADLTVVVEGSSAFSGREALAKAAEVRELLEALRRAGLDPETVRLRSVSLKSGSWSAIRSSAARYVLVIKGVSIDRLSSILAVVAAQKGADLTHLEWAYPGEAEARAKLLRAAIDAALTQARSDAEALGVELLGIHDLQCEEPYVAAWQAPKVGADLDLMVGRARAAGPPDLGFELGASKTLRLELRAEFRVGVIGAS